MANHTNTSSFKFQSYTGSLRSFSPLPDLVAPVAAFTGLSADTLLLISFICFALPSSATYFLKHSLDTALDYITSAVYVSEDDEFYFTFLAWLRQHDSAKALRCAEIHSNRSTGAWWTDEAKYRDFEDSALSDLAKPDIMNFSQMNAGIPPLISPYFDSENRIWHKGRLFFIERMRRMAGRDEKEVEEIRIRTFGLTTKAILSLVMDIQMWNANENSETATTQIFYTEARRFGRWRLAGDRPSRPLSTVDMDDQVKSLIVADVNEFFRPRSKNWYARRGIPYRRGYMMTGPPGTGKSSLSFALASTFGLPVYIVTIRDPEMNDAILCASFRDLPERCLVLLEDIDTAGLGDDRSDEDDGDAATSGSKPDRFGVKKEKKQSGVTLSGLLNAIDGVGSHEGHILVMTTNHMEHLDPALIRPGRVDFRVHFTLATADRIRRIFLRMYHDDADPTPHLEKQRSWTAAELRELAGRFAAKVPADTFSPAELQNFLIIRKRDPERAVEEIAGWVEESLKAKAAEMAAKEDAKKVGKRELTNGVR